MKKFTKITLREEMKRRKVKVPALSEVTGIPKDRIYAWYRDNTNPKKEDQEILEKWINEVPFKKNEETGIDDPLPFGGVRVTLLDYIHEIQQQKDFLQELLRENMIKVAANLEIVVGKAEGLQFDLISGRETVLKSLARIEEKPVLSLLNESDKLRASLAKQADELSRKSASGK